ncbi:MAG: secretin and TonB N-terminal domain-containing protein [Candidatus Omnitrophica bacterium]|nr:secretin and TonB N-terminal domain-containing protein [Candidatus Omnitrophota bacterium]
MKKQGQKIFFKAFLGVFLFFIMIGVGFAQDTGNSLPASKEDTAVVSAQDPQLAAAVKRDINTMDNVTLDFKDADIRNILKIIAQKSGVNIVATPDVVGTVTIKLVEVPWDRAMDIILKSNGFGYQRQGNVILVTKIENMSKIQSEEPLRTEIINLKFLDAQDAMRILIPMLTARGKISVLYNKGQKGWNFGTFKIGKERVDSAMQQKESETSRSELVSVEKSPTGQLISTRMDTVPSVKSKVVIITDTDSSLDKIKTLILPQIDRKPKQVLVEARIMEVNENKLKDIGVDYGTGADGTTTLTSLATGSTTTGANTLTSRVSPTNFSSMAATVTSALSTTTTSYNTGLNLLYQKLNGTQFAAMLHALEENVHANTLSAPRIVTLDNQEASMLVGYHTPILSSSVTAGTDSTGPTQTQTLDYYQEIGIRLNVVPQVSDEGYINMIIHPSVTSSTSSVTATNIAGSNSTTGISSKVDYPIIDVREAQTQILMKDGETIVIGGLLKDVQSKSMVGVPFLSKIPLLGVFFRRETNSVEKVDLLIFITAHIIKDDEFSPEEIAKIEKGMQGIKDKSSRKEKEIK